MGASRPARRDQAHPTALGDSNAEDRRTVLGRFEREAQATASLRSPHTIELCDFGVSDTGTFYYVMELLDGFDATVLVEKFGPVPAERAVHILLQVCDSLGEAHAAGMVHRDIKPSNISVCRYGRALDARSDLHATGCVAYWLLTGRYVFEAANPIQIMVQHAQSTPVPPSERCELPIPAALEQVVMACLEKDPANCPQSADALADALVGAATDGSWTRERARQWWEERHTAAGSPPSAPC